MADHDPLQTFLTMLRWTAESLSDEVIAIDCGVVVRSHASPLVRGLNQLRIASPIGFDECVGLADAYMGDLRFRYVAFEIESTGRELEGEFIAAGWRVGREVVQLLSAPPDRVADTSIVEDLSEEQMLELMRQWALEEHVGITDARLAQLNELNVRTGALWNERRIGITDGRGTPLSVAKLRVRDGAAWVEDVYTTEQARGLGYGRVVVSHAAGIARESGAGLTFIQADEDDWPKDLYRRIGFRPIGHIRTFAKGLEPA